MNNRESGIDIVRCTAAFFLMVLHSFGYNGFYAEAQTGIFIWLADSVRWLTYCCVPLFLLITGYLKSTKPINRNWFWSIVPILVSYTVVCCISFPVQHFLLGDRVSLKNWIIRFLDFANYAWYVEMYIGLMLIAPAVNLALNQLKQPGQLLTAVGIMLFVTALPSLTVYPVLPDYWVAFYPITYYVIGAAIRRLQPQIGTRKGVAVILLLALGTGALSVLSTDGVFDDSLQDYNGILATCLSVAIFVTLYRIKPGKYVGKIAAWMAGGCFECYLLSILFDMWVYDLVPQWHSPATYPLLWILITVPAFAASILLGKLTHAVVQKIMIPLNRVKQWVFKEKLPA